MGDHRAAGVEHLPTGRGSLSPNIPGQILRAKDQGSQPQVGHCNGCQVDHAAGGFNQRKQLDLRPCGQDRSQVFHLQPRPDRVDPDQALCPAKIKRVQRLRDDRAGFGFPVLGDAVLKLALVHDHLPVFEVISFVKLTSQFVWRT